MRSLSNYDEVAQLVRAPWAESSPMATLDDSEMLAEVGGSTPSLITIL